VSAYKYYEENDDREEKMNHHNTVGFDNEQTKKYVQDLNKRLFDKMERSTQAGSESHSKINYKYNEDKILQEIAEYIDGTYGEHYSKGKIQSTEIAIDRGRGLHFCLGNVDKYSGRYGQKGTPEDWRKDLMKVVHYGIITLFIHDLEHNKED